MLLDLARTLSTTNDLDTALDAILDTAMLLSGSDCAAIYLKDASNGSFMPARHKGPAGSSASGTAGVISLNTEGDTGRLNVRMRAEGEIPAETRRGLETLAALAGGVIARIHAEKDLREKESRMEAILDALPDMIFLLDRNGVLIDCHAPDPAMFFMPPEEYPVTKELADFPPGFHRNVGDLIKKVLETRQLEIACYSLSIKGVERFYEARMVPCGNDRVLGIIRDVSEEKRLEIKLLERERLAAVGQTMSMAAHCTKNVFSSLRGAVSLLDMGIKENNHELCVKACGILQRSSSRLYTLISEMLDYSKVKAPEFKEIHPALLFEELANMLSMMGQGQYEIERIVEPEVETVRLDPDLTFRTLLNLGKNAIDAMPDGGKLRFFAGLVRRKADPEMSGGRRRHEQHFLIEIRDTGTGILPEHQKELFRPLFSTKGSQGTGLGLATVKQFVEAQGGKVYVDSEPGRGTSFRLYFPFETS
ncbi:MAG TPA: ATP-binding protein [Candidatus Sumerlaeota bacterium]|nr:ATP-binding protein [Candidatus Sumerlaeota bacterium]